MDQLRNHAADGPHVHRRGVQRPAHDDLGRPIPSSGDIVRDGHYLVVVSTPVHPRQAEVCQLQQTITVDEDVARPARQEEEKKKEEEDGEQGGRKENNSENRTGE